MKKKISLKNFWRWAGFNFEILTDFSAIQLDGKGFFVIQCFRIISINLGLLHEFSIILIEKKSNKNGNRFSITNSLKLKSSRVWVQLFLQYRKFIHFVQGSMNLQKKKLLFNSNQELSFSSCLTLIAPNFYLKKPSVIQKISFYCSSRIVNLAYLIICRTPLKKAVLELCSLQKFNPPKNGRIGYPIWFFSFISIFHPDMFKLMPWWNNPPQKT